MGAITQAKYSFFVTQFPQGPITPRGEKNRLYLSVQPVFCSYSQPFSVSAQASYFATFSAHSALLAPWARM